MARRLGLGMGLRRLELGLGLGLGLGLLWLGLGLGRMGLGLEPLLVVASLLVQPVPRRLLPSAVCALPVSRLSNAPEVGAADARSVALAQALGAPPTVSPTRTWPSGGPRHALAVHPRWNA